MDPLAHTLFGAALAETGLKRLSRYATATLIVGANAPDVDALVSFWGEDASLLWRRGHTHGVLAMAVFPWLIAGLMAGIHRWRGRPASEPRFRFLPLVGLAYLGVLSHPLLDWMNTYGVRLLMPFDGRWFYGDSLFIVDPWFWLLAGTAVILARSNNRWSLGAWVMLGCATTALILLTDVVGLWVRILWLTAVAAIVVARWQCPSSAAATRVARVLVALLVLYVGLMVVGSRVARAQALAWLRERNVPVENAYVVPEPAHPFVREVIGASPSHYHRLEVRWGAGGGITELAPPLSRLQPGRLIRAALSAPHVQGTRQWLRIPHFRIEPLEGDRTRVVIHDLRYDSRGTDGLGTRVVEVPSSPD